jgi:hypothetical protein
MDECRGDLPECFASSEASATNSNELGSLKNDCRLLLRRVVWSVWADVSEVLSAFIIKMLNEPRARSWLKVGNQTEKADRRWTVSWLHEVAALR